MHRPSIWLMLVIFLACLFFLREPRLQRFDDTFLRWLLKNAPANGVAVPLTIVDIGGDSILPKNRTKGTNDNAAQLISPVEYALFLQAALEFNPTVVAFEPILQWDGRQKDQEVEADAQHNSAEKSEYRQQHGEPSVATNAQHHAWRLTTSKQARLLHCRTESNDESCA